MSPKLLSTVEAAEEVGVSRPTLQYWIKEGKIAVPKTRLRKGMAVRLWTAAHIEKAKKLKVDLKRGPQPVKTRGKRKA